MSPTAKQVDVLRHALGLGRERTPYRNHFVTGPGSDDFDDCRALVAAGLMKEYRSSPLSGGNPIFAVTAAGRAAALAAQDQKHG